MHVSVFQSFLDVGASPAWKSESLGSGLWEGPGQFGCLPLHVGGPSPVERCAPEAVVGGWSLCGCRRAGQDLLLAVEGLRLPL